MAATLLRATALVGGRRPQWHYSADGAVEHPVHAGNGNHRDGGDGQLGRGAEQAEADNGLDNSPCNSSQPRQAGLPRG